MRYLRYFLVVAEEQSFTRAADRVHIEPSPLSRAIGELESELGVPLLYRRKGRTRLTWAGEVFREEAQRMLTFMEGARFRVRSAAKGYRGMLRIGLADGLAQPRLIRLLARCREEEPLTEIRIIEMTVGEMTQALDHHQIDAGFTIHTGLHGLVKEAVWTDRPVIAVPRNYALLSLDKVSLQEIVRQPLILCHPRSCSGGYDVVCRWFDHSGLPEPMIAEYVAGQETMLMLVAAGYGIGIGLKSQIGLHRHPDVILRPITDNVPDTVTFLVALNSPLTDELGRFIDRARQIGETPLDSW
jgi:DNA-binding transcriptional LysR family regulator